MGERGRKEPSTSTSGVRLENSFDFKKGTVDVELVLCPAAFLSRGQPPMPLPPRMRWAARAALLVASVRASMTWEEAQCVVAGRRIAFFGDSLSRFCYFGFNTFLATGEVRDHEFDVSEGDGENSNDYDSFDTWNDNGLVSDGKNHRMHLRKDFAEYGAHTEYYFIQNVWYDDLDDTPLEADVEIGDADNEGFIADIVAGDETIRSISLDLDADVVVFNMGWWVLKHKYVDYDCGEKWDSKCADWYEEMMDLVVENLLVADGRVGVYRTTSCCGEKLGRKHKIFNTTSM